MKVVALISGGKDSIYSMMRAIENGHEIVCLANMKPPSTSKSSVSPFVDVTSTTVVDVPSVLAAAAEEEEAKLHSIHHPSVQETPELAKGNHHPVGELDSFMYQSVGYQYIELIAQCMGLPLMRREIRGSAVVQTMEYTPDSSDEVEDLMLLLSQVVQRFPEVKAVCSGAIMSNYQRLRVENVCQRLGLVSIADLWMRDQYELLKEMVEHNVHAILIKVAAMGLSPHKHLGKSIQELYDELIQIPYIHVCGEGGEYETFVLDCPLYQKGYLVVDQGEILITNPCKVAPVAYFQFQCHFVPRIRMRPVITASHNVGRSDDLSVSAAAAGTECKIASHNGNCDLTTAMSTSADDDAI